MASLEQLKEWTMESMAQDTMMKRRVYLAQCSPLAPEVPEDDDAEFYRSSRTPEFREYFITEIMKLGKVELGMFMRWLQKGSGRKFFSEDYYEQRNLINVIKEAMQRLG